MSINNSQKLTAPLVQPTSHDPSFAPPAAAIQLIDTDVHNHSSASDLLPYLSTYWKEWVSSKGLGNTAGHYTSPVGVLRSDAVPPGGGAPGSDPVFLAQEMDKNYKALRSTAPWLTKLPSEYIREHIRLTTQPIEEPKNPEHILQIFEMMDAKNTVMFSSDYPHWDFDNPKMALPPLKGELKERILWKNAAELYKLGGAAA